MPLLTNRAIAGTRVSRIRRVLQKIISLRFDWSFPRKTEILILFTDTASQLSSYFPDRQVTVLDLESPRRNLWILLLSAAGGSIRIGRYLSTYISRTRPDLVLSAQDNFEPLWFLRSRHKTAIALVQNGLRVDYEDSLQVPSQSSKYGPKVDFYFCFNSSIGDFIRRRVDATYVPIGSFRSNHEPRTAEFSDEKVSYISTFRADLPSSTLIPSSVPGGFITYESILERRIQILIEVAAFCDQSGLSLELLGKDKDYSAEESFYREHLGRRQFNFKPRIPGSFQYLQCDSARIVVSTGSTLGLESLSRGNRTAVFDPLSQILSNPSFQFGWPVLDDPEGPFWSTEASPSRIQQVLSSILAASDEQWKETLDDYRDALPLYDPGNSTLVRELHTYGARLNKRKESRNTLH